MLGKRLDRRNARSRFIAACRVLGEDHPDTLAMEMNLVGLLVRMDRSGEAIDLLEDIGPLMLGRARAEFAATRQARVKRRTLNRPSSTQGVVMGLARSGGPGGHVPNGNGGKDMGRRTRNRRRDGRQSTLLSRRR